MKPGAFFFTDHTSTFVKIHLADFVALTKRRDCVQSNFPARAHHKFFEIQIWSISSACTMVWLNGNIYCLGRIYLEERPHPNSCHKQCSRGGGRGGGELTVQILYI